MLEVMRCRVCLCTYASSCLQAVVNFFLARLLREADVIHLRLGGLQTGASAEQAVKGALDVRIRGQRDVSTSVPFRSAFD